MPVQQEPEMAEARPDETTARTSSYSPRDEMTKPQAIQSGFPSLYVLANQLADQGIQRLLYSRMLAVQRSIKRCNDQTPQRFYPGLAL